MMEIQRQSEAFAYRVAEGQHKRHFFDDYKYLPYYEVEDAQSWLLHHPQSQNEEEEEHRHRAAYRTVDANSLAHNIIQAAEEADFEWQRSYSDGDWELTTRTPEGVDKTVVTEPRTQGMHYSANPFGERQAQSETYRLTGPHEVKEGDYIVLKGTKQDWQVGKINHPKYVPVHAFTDSGRHQTKILRQEHFDAGRVHKRGTRPT